MLTTLLDLAARTPVAAVVVIAALVLAAESGTPWGMALPGTTVAAGLGVWTALGGHSVPVAMAAAAVGTVAGAHVGWWRGRRGAALPRIRVRRVTAALDRAERWVGGRSAPATTALVAAGHWASALRPLVPRVTASAGVHYRWAGPALAVSGSGWAATLVGLGAWLGPHAATAVPWAGALAAVAVVGTLVTRSAPRARVTRPGRGRAGAGPCAASPGRCGAGRTGRSRGGARST